jgi:malate dehydrogenase (oxaloacetate-decarboxylating)
VLDIPVFHDDQHGTAIVVLAALQNALRVVGKRLEDTRIVVTGAGAAGAATARMLAAAGAGEIVCCDLEGALYAGFPGLDSFRAALAADTNPRRLHGSSDEALAGADVYIGLSGPGAVSVDGIRSMAKDAIVFAMANPTPEIAPEEIEHLVAVVGTGRSDYPNQINNVLVFPGLFRGALDVRATAITEGMKIAAALALANVVPSDHLEADYVLPSVLDRAVAPAIADAVARAAIAEGVARCRRVEPAVVTS